MSDFDVQSQKLEQELKALQLPEGPTKSLLERSLEIASLEAKLDRQRQTLTKAPRTRRLTATSTRQSSDALYMNQWLHKIETIGNLNYPAEAKRQNISGSLRLMVAVRADGTIHELKVMESSGHKILDDAAKHIVRLAAPFAPFSEEMRKQADILEIIRTWQFQQTQFSTNS
jgi:protein TonB